VLLTQFKEVVLDDCYFRGLRLDKINSRGLTVVDVGANVGIFAVFAASLFPGSRIVCVEPLDSNISLLQKNLSLNCGCEFITVPKALRSAEGTLRLNTPQTQDFPTGASVFKYTEGRTFDVPAMGIAQLFKDHVDGRIGLLKMDCEGSEYDIFYNMPADLLARINNMAVEVHIGFAAEENIQSLYLFLSKAGFHCLMSSENDFIWASRDRKNIPSVL
jgi:FkbM family methyltransferase